MAKNLNTAAARAKPVRPLRILILEDAPADAELMKRVLRKADMAFEAKRVETVLRSSRRSKPSSST